LPKKLIPAALCYDFDGTLAPGNMQERDFIPQIGMSTATFWKEVVALSEKHEADNILMYMRLMLQKALAAEVQVRRENFTNYGSSLSFFPGVYSTVKDNWFKRITAYARESGIALDHYIVSSGIKEMVEGTPVGKFFKRIYASAFMYDHHGIAVWPALALNYTTKTQYLFRINKGTLDVYDHTEINRYIPQDQRAVPFEHMIYIGDGETDIPCFRLLKDQGGHSVAVYEGSKKGARQQAAKIHGDGRVNFVAVTDYTEGSVLDRVVKGIIDKIASDMNLKMLAQP
jgi:hypothetical protein